MYPVTHLVVHTFNRTASPVTPPSIASPRRRRRADASDGVAIRAAGPDDAAILSNLAQIDSAPLAAERLSRLAADPAAGTVLVADLDGHPVAALDVDRDCAVADPFEPTASLVAMLRLRARQLTGTRTRRLPHIGVPHLRTP
jgi:hypothetical protein